MVPGWRGREAGGGEGGGVNLWSYIRVVIVCQKLLLL